MRVIVTLATLVACAPLDVRAETGTPLDVLANQLRGAVQERGLQLVFSPTLFAHWVLGWRTGPVGDFLDPAGDVPEL